MMAVAAAQKNREMFAIKKSYSIEVSIKVFIMILIMNSIQEKTVKSSSESSFHCGNSRNVRNIRFNWLDIIHHLFPSKRVSTFSKAHLECTFFVVIHTPLIARNNKLKLET